MLGLKPQEQERQVQGHSAPRLDPGCVSKTQGAGPPG